MINRRNFISLSLGSVATSAVGLPVLESGRVALYANVGAVLWHWEVDAANATLTRRGSVTLPAGVQYAWPHVSRRCLYVVSSDMVKRHFLTALKVDPATGELSQLGESVALPARPIHVSTDLLSNFVLVAFNDPSGVRVFRVQPDQRVGAEVPEPGVVDGGNYAHQIRVTPDGQHAILVTRGNPATATKPEDPGGLKMFDYARGVLSHEVSVAPNGGKGFGPRHLDFHPTRPWVYVSLETQSKLFMYRLEHGRLASAPDFMTDTVADPDHKKPRQIAGTIHVHPNGKFVYVANRADSTVDFAGKKVFAGGENSISVFSINPLNGEPTAIQRIDTRKVHPRTFQIDPSQRILVVQHNLPVNVRDGDSVRVLSAGLTVYRLQNDGTLHFERVYDIDTGQDTMWWMGMLKL
jgi:6-phosphogluconolactonase